MIQQIKTESLSFYGYKVVYQVECVVIQVAMCAYQETITRNLRGSLMDV